MGPLPRDRQSEVSECQTQTETVRTASGGMKLTYDVKVARSRQIMRQMRVRAHKSQRVCSVTERVEVLDQKNFVSFLAVD